MTQLLDTKLGLEVRFLFSLSQTWHHLPAFPGVGPHAGALCFQSDTPECFRAHFPFEDLSCEGEGGGSSVNIDY